MRNLLKLAQVNLFGGSISVAPTSWKGSDWLSLPIQERAVQWAAHFARVEKVREVGNNGGYWVKLFLSRVGLGGGYAWCAAFVSELLFRAGWFKFKSAAVLGWRDWGERSRVIVWGAPQRGDLAYWVRGSGKSQKRHIEIVINPEGSACPKFVHESGFVPKGFVHTIGGNTGAGSSGSQEDGDGVYDRLRRVSEYSAFIRWWKS